MNTLRADLLLSLGEIHAEHVVVNAGCRLGTLGPYRLSCITNGSVHYERPIPSIAKTGDSSADVHLTLVLTYVQGPSGSACDGCKQGTTGLLPK